MKQYFLWSVVLGLSLNCSAGVWSSMAKGSLKLSDEVVEIAAKVSGKSLKGNKLAREAIEQGVRRYGDEMIEFAAKGGNELIEATVKHGDDVLKFANEVPKATKLLAQHADELVPLTRKFGIEVLEMEVKSPGVSKLIIKEFGEYAIPIFAKNIPKRDAVKLLGFGRKADSPATNALLLKSYKSNGGEFLKNLSWKHIMAGGLSSAAIVSAVGAKNSMEKIAENSPEVLVETVDNFFWPLRLFMYGVAALMLVLVYRWIHELMPKNKVIVNKGDEGKKKINSTK